MINRSVLRDAVEMYEYCNIDQSVFFDRGKSLNVIKVCVFRLPNTAPMFLQIY